MWVFVCSCGVDMSSLLRCEVKGKTKYEARWRDEEHTLLATRREPTRRTAQPCVRNNLAGMLRKDLLKFC